MANDVQEYKPDLLLAGRIFDALPKSGRNWAEMLATIGVVLADVYMAGSENKPKKIEIFTAYPESEIAHKRNKGYRITIEQMEG